MINIQFLQEIKKNKKLFKRGIIFIFSAFLILTIFFSFIKSSLLGYGNENHFISVMSTIAQSQAAIIAIIISLSIIIVQLTAERYSPRITPIFFKQNIFWALLGIYGISILYDILVLWTTGDNQLGTYIGISLMIIALGVLFFYIEYVITVLNPSKVVEIISKDIKAGNIDSFLSASELVENDPLIAISDIITSAMNVNDQISIINGVNGIKDIFEKTSIFMEEKYHIPLGTEPDQFDKETLVKSEKFDNMAIYFGNVITDISSECIEKGLFFAAIHSIKTLKAMFFLISTIDNYNKNAAGNFIVNAAEIDSVIEKFLEKEGYKGKRGDKKTVNLIKTAIEQITEMVKEAVENNFDTVPIDFAVNLFGEIGQKNLKKNKEEFITFSDTYEINHDFKGSFRLHAIVKSFLEIKGSIIDTIPIITTENIHEWEDGIKYTYYQDLLITFDKIQYLLLKYCSFAVKNEYKFLANNIFVSYNVDLGKLINKNYDIVYEDPHPIKITLNTCRCFLKISNSKMANDISKEMATMLKNYAKLVNKKSDSFEDIIGLLFDIYNYNYSYSMYMPTGALKKAPEELGEIAINLIDENNPEKIIKVSEKFKNVITFVNSPNWDIFVDTVLQYIILLCIKLIKNGNLELCDSLSADLIEINHLLKTKGWNNLLRDNINEIEDNNEFRFVFKIKTEYDPVFKGKFNKPASMALSKEYIKPFELFKEKMKKVLK